MWKLLPFLVVFCGVAQGQQKPDPRVAAKIAFLEKQIAEEERKLATLKAELAKVKPAPALKGLPWTQLNIGDVGTFTGDGGLLPKIQEIIDNETMLVRMTHQRDTPVVMVKYPTKGLAEDRFLNEDTDFLGPWKVTGTKKHGSTTYYVIEPAK